MDNVSQIATKFKAVAHLFENSKKLGEYIHNRIRADGRVYPCTEDENFICVDVPHMIVIFPITEGGVIDSRMIMYRPATVRVRRPCNDAEAMQEAALISVVDVEDMAMSVIEDAGEEALNLG